MGFALKGFENNIILVDNVLKNI